MAQKRIVVCTDGTWNDPTAASKLTNVDKLARAVQRSDPRGVPQVVAYVPGVGTGADFIDRWIGGATGLGISRNIRNAYTFVVQNFTPGDELFLFGFSRGAFTARSLAGLIRNAGVLRPEHGHRIGEAYDLYRSRDPEAHPTSVSASEFRKRYSYGDTPITFIGVWDTVGALGVPLSILGYAVKLWGVITGKPYLHEFHDVALSSYVDHAYHAVAIDEHREAFRPTLWDPGTRRPDQTFEQVWFPGDHCDVGGGNHGTGLSDGALLWLADRARRHGLALDTDVLHPRLREDPRTEPSSSQGPLYRAVALLKKLNGHTARFGLSDADVADLRRNVDWTGNYIRPVPPNAVMYSPSATRQPSRPAAA